MSKTAIFLILFALLVAGFFGFWFYRSGVFSKEILKLEILGPDKAKTGDEVEYTIKYKNNGNFVLEQPKLIFELPENSLTEDGKTRLTQNLKDVYPGAQEIVKFKTRLLGKEGDLKTAKAYVSYTPKNLTARYEAETTFTTQIQETPITLEFDLPSKVEKGKEIQYAVNYFSNIDYPLENLSLKVDPVQGFDVTGSDPKTLDNSEWKLQTLNKAQGGRINIKGIVSASTGGTISFTAKLGVWSEGQFIVIKESTAQVQVIEPLLFISQQVQGSANYAASPGERLHYEIYFRNIGSTPFENLFMVVRLDSPALDMQTVQAPGAQVQPGDGLVVWDWKQSSQLRHLDVQQEGKVEFYVKLKDSWTTSEADRNNTVIKDSVNISQITQEFTVRVNSGLDVVQSAQYGDSAIKNTGPIPPVAGQSTAYTITWDVSNYFNDAKNVKVKAVLPNNVNLTGRLMPTDEAGKFSFDSQSREIVWLVGDVPAGTGVRGDPLTLSFQVSLTPSSVQKGSPAQLAGDVSVTGEDQFTGALITGGGDSINTALPNESDSGIVK